MRKPAVAWDYRLTVYQTVADVIRTCLGPKAMLKMILDPMGGILYVPMRAVLSRRI